MTASLSAPRPARKSVGAAFVGTIATLVIFVTVFVAFLVAPLLLLGVAFLAYLALRPRDPRPAARAAGAETGAGTGLRPTSPTGFGAGAR